MSGTVTTPPYAAFSASGLSDQEKADVREFCGYPLYGTGGVVFPMPWIMKEYLALEYRMNNMAPAEYQRARQYLSILYGLDSAVTASGANLDTDKAAVWTHNKNEVRDRIRLLDTWRRRLADFLGVPTGPNMGGGDGGTIRMVV